MPSLINIGNCISRNITALPEKTTQVLRSFKAEFNNSPRNTISSVMPAKIALNAASALNDLFITMVPF